MITGSNSGVGFATAERCFNEGASIIGLDLSAPPSNDPRRMHQSVDVSSRSSWQEFAEQLDDNSIDHLHLNAGVQSAAPEAALADYQFGNLDIERYQKMMGVNVDGVVLGLHFLLPKLKPGGSIVVTGSLAGITPYDVDPLYSMSKHAVTGLVRSLRSELEDRQLKINALCPGGIDTNLIPHEQRVAAAEFMTPDDIAQEVIRLFTIDESGATWAKVSAAKPAWVIHPPGKRN